MEANCRAWIGTLNLIWLNHQKLGSDQTELCYTQKGRTN